MSQQKTFEQALAELESIVAQLESGSLSLEQSIALYEQGMKASVLCEQQLKSVEQKIEIVTSSSEELLKSTFQVPADKE
jgi:exodeoxyribonuclease VII small subunit